MSGFDEQWAAERWGAMCEVHTAAPTSQLVLRLAREAYERGYQDGVKDGSPMQVHVEEMEGFAMLEKNQLTLGGPAIYARDTPKRDLFERAAIAAMQGLCLQASPGYEKGPCNAALVERAVILARALVEAMGKEQV